MSKKLIASILLFIKKYFGLFLTWTVFREDSMIAFRMGRGGAV